MNTMIELQDTADDPANDPIVRAQNLVALLQEAGPAIDVNRGLTPDVVEAVHAARMIRVMLPTYLGGDSLDLRRFAEVIEIIATGDASTAWCTCQGSGCAMSSAFLDPAAAKRLFGPADAVLAWGAGVQGKAVAVEGGYLVTGNWQFASGSRHATLLGGHSWVFEADGETPRRHANGKRADRTALFAREKATVHDVWNTLGLRGTGSDTFEVQDLFVPADETVDRAAQDELTDFAPIYRIPSSLVYSIGFAALQIGVARAQLDNLRELATKKLPRGGKSVLCESPVFQTQLAQLHGRLRAIRAYLHQVAEETYGEARDTGALSLEGRISIRLAATHIINEGVAITTDGYRMAGATAIFPENKFERRLRDALTASQQVQGRIDHFETVGRHLLDLAPDSNMFL
jgi:alkylation response protein AidB-like acyl-CoA dehydrogenase